MSRLDKLLLGAILLSLLLGALLSTREAPFSRPDEAAHYLRAVEVAHGKWLNRKGDLGVDIRCKTISRSPPNGRRWLSTAT